MKIAQLFEQDISEKQDATGLTPDQYKAQELARKQAGAEKYANKQTATPASTPGAGVFGGMASQLAGDPNAPTASSTGGVTTPTTTGQVHKAAATNPNQPQTTAAAPAVDPNASAQTPAPAGAKGAVTGLANTVGGVAKGVGAVAGGVKGAWDAAKSGFQKGRAAVSGQPAPASSALAPAAGGALGGANIGQLQARLAAVEKAVGIAEGFESKFLGMKI